MTTTSLPTTTHPAPLALGITGWPTRVPRFDRVYPGPKDVLRVPITSGQATGAPGGSLRKVAQVTLFDGRSAQAREGTAGTLPSLAADGQAKVMLDEPPEAIPAGDLSQWIDRLADGEVCANRRGSPDLLAQLHSALRRPIDTVVCSILDSDPAACVQSAIAATHPTDLIAGVTLLGRICGAARTWIALDGASPSNWWPTLRAEARKAQVRIVELVNDYPQADPTLLLYSLTGRRLRPGRLPAELGVLVIDAAAAVAVGAAALRGARGSRQYLVIRDHDHSESYFVDAPAGMSAGQVLAAANLPGTGGVSSSTNRPRVLRGGDVLRDQRLTPDAVVGGGSELVLHVSTAAPPVNPDPCIRCAWCFESCPTRIQPANLLEASQHRDMHQAERAGLAACIECGICTYVCPSGLPILSGIRALRKNER